MFFTFRSGFGFCLRIWVFLFFSIIYTVSFLYIIFLDWKFYYLPFKCNLLLVVAGFVGNSFFNIFISDISLFFNLTPFLFSFYGFLIGYFSLWIINFIFKLIYKADGIGGGDFILFGAIGALFGPFSLGLILFISAVCGCFIFVLFKNKFKSQIPLGSCLIFGSLLYFLIKNFELLSNLIVI
jgi:leader peptidase (prepilin peptidase)/N-methyltransferase